MKRRELPLLGTGLAAAFLAPRREALAQPAARTLTVAQPNDALTMDPARHSAFPTANIMFHLYDALVTQDSNGDFQPALATSWSNPDPLTWRFVLRQGVKFHNGQDFDAQAVKFTFDRALNPDFRAPYYSRIAAIKSVEIVDRHDRGTTLAMRLRADELHHPDPPERIEIGGGPVEQQHLRPRGERAGNHHPAALAG